MKPQPVPLERIYVPTKRRQTLDAKKLEALIDAILSEGLREPIMVRRDGERFVLVEGLHRLEACRALGETTIQAFLVQARNH